MRDDRGKRYRLSRDAKKMLADSDSVVGQKAIKLMPWPFRMFMRLYGMIMAVLVLAVVASCGGMFYIRADVVSDIPGILLFVLVWSFIVLASIGILFPLLLNYPNLWNRRAARIVRVCFACCYKLDGIQPESDGCTVCPECGAAWKLSETTKTLNEPLA